MKGAILVALNVALGVSALAVVDTRHRFKPWETDSVVLAMPADHEVELALLGTSRAQFLSRYQVQHACLESLAGGEVVNLGLPFGGGIVPTKTLLAYFYHRGNRAKTVLYFLDPFVFYARKVNEEHRFVYYEPLRPFLLGQFIGEGFPYGRIMIYIQSKFTYRWFSQRAAPLMRRLEALTTADIGPGTGVRRTRGLYPEGQERARFEEYAGTLHAIIRLAQEHGARFICAFPPTLLEREPGVEELRALVQACVEEYGIEFYDLADSVPDPAYYHDYDHLNTAGVEYVAREVLAPILAGAGAS